MDKQPMERVGALVEKLEECTDPELRETARELVSTLLEFHGNAIARILDRVRLSQDGTSILDSIGKDPAVGGVLLLHDCHPMPLDARIEMALEQVRPTLRTHKGDVELTRIDSQPSGPVVLLKLKGTCNGCPSSTTTFRNLIESAVAGVAPEIAAIQVDGLNEASKTTAPQELRCGN